MTKFNLVRTDLFDDSLVAIIQYIARDNATSASQFLESTLKAIETIPFFPEKAKKISEGIHVKIHKGYWIPYCIDGDTIYLLDILHPRQDSKAKIYLQ